MADHIRYDLLTQQALRSVMRQVLVDAAKKGLPGDHHFYITFDTRADDVVLSDRLRAQYPEEMTVILQHQFWNLAVTETGFSVGLSFGGIPEKLGIPFDAIHGFFDPSVQFGLQFEEITEGMGQNVVPANSEEKSADGKSADGKLAEIKPPAETKRRLGPAKKTIAPAMPPVAAASPSTAQDDETPPEPKNGGGEVVRLDRFRKKK